MTNTWTEEQQIFVDIEIAKERDRCANLIAAGIAGARNGALQSLFEAIKSGELPPT